jgi:membrane protein DedA with SNARE-associated domain
MPPGLAFPTAPTAPFAPLAAPLLAAMVAPTAAPLAALDLSGIDDPFLQAALIALATVATEDGAAIGAGLLVAAGRVPLAVAMTGTAVGVFGFEMCMYAMGAAAARGARGTAWIRRRLPEERLDWLRDQLARRRVAAIFLARFVAAARVPVYVGAGFLGVGFASYAAWTAIALVVWTPLVVGGTALFGARAIALLDRFGSLGRAAGFALVVVAIVAASALVHRSARRRAATRRG